MSLCSTISARACGRRFLCLVPVIAVALLIFFQWRPLVDANWSIRDDYRFVSLMGPEGSISFRTFLEQCNPPQDWHLGSMVNRPTYYAVHSLWMFLFGNNVLLWQLAKLGVLFLAFWGVARILVDNVGYVLGLSLLFLYSTHPLWGDIVPRANSELFAAAGIPMLILGYQRWVISPTVSPRWVSIGWLCVAIIGGVAAAGSKENFTVLSALVCLLLLSDAAWVRRGKQRLDAVILVVPILVWATIVGGYIFSAVRKAGGANLYGQPLTTWAGLGELGYKFISLHELTGVLLVAGFSLASVWLALALVRRAEPIQRYTAIRFFVFSLFLLVAGAFLFFFYAGTIAVDRYAYPFRLLPLLWFAGLFWLTRERLPQLYRFVSFPAAVVIVCFALWMQPQKNALRAINYAENTQLFQKELTKLSDYLLKNPSIPVLFESYAHYDQEAVASVKIYLRARGVENVIYLKIVNYSEESFSREFDKHMVRLIKGQVGEGKNFLDASLLPSGGTVARATFSFPSQANDAVASFYMLP